MLTQSVYKYSDLYTITKKMVHACYELVQDLPEDEKDLSGKKIRIAALSAYLNILQGLATKSKKKFFRKAKMNLLLVDGLLELYKELNLISPDKTNELHYLLVRCAELLKKPSDD